MLHDEVSGGMPNTLTEMYVYLLLCQTDRMRDGDYPAESDSIILKLAELAFRQLEKGKLIFYEADLKECGMEVEEATIYSGLCTQESRRGRLIGVSGSFICSPLLHTKKGKRSPRVPEKDVHKMAPQVHVRFPQNGRRQSVTESERPVGPVPPLPLGTVPEVEPRTDGQDRP